jgi:tetrachlorobenzoquinone reductase
VTEALHSDAGFDVHLQRSGRTVTVPPGESILDILLDAGVNVSFSCTEGFCGTCETKVIDGIPDHRDSFLTDEEKAENSKIMICCSRAKSPVLTLDL